VPNSKAMPLACSTWEKDEYQVMQEVIDSGNFTMGEKVRAFEKSFAEYHDSKYCIMVNSGSSANFLMVAALFFSRGENRLNKGDEVIVPAVSWSTTYSPLYYHGLKLRFVDIDSSTLNMNSEIIEAAITKDTRAILAVNLLGNPCEYKAIKDICERNNLVLLEDNCESLGADYEKKKSGTFGFISTCSSFFSHHISTMEGGMILTDDEEIYHILLSIRAHGWTRNLPRENLICDISDDPFYESFRFVLPGYNVRPLELSGAIGIEQLKKLPDLIEKRRSNAKFFKEKMSGLDFINIQEEIGSSSWFGFAITINERASFARTELVDSLQKQKIETRPIVCGNILQNEMTDFFDYSVFDEPVASQRVHTNGLFVGNHHIDMIQGLENLHSTICHLQK